MNADTYREITRQTITGRITSFDHPAKILYFATGFGGEAGEAMEKIKKFVRDDNIDLVGLTKELGDVLWYMARIIDFFGLTFDEVFEANVAKLFARQEAGTLHGSGDDR